MASAFELRAEPGIGDGQDLFEWNEAGWHDQNVRIVVLFDEDANLFVPSQSGTDAFVVVEAHGHTVSGTAHRDSAVHFMAFHSQCQRMGDIRVILAVRRVCAEIDDFKALGFQFFDESCFVLDSCVVAADSYFQEFQILVCPDTNVMLFGEIGNKKEVGTSKVRPLFVRAKGIEPIRLTALDPKSSLSTNFNTPADRIAKVVYFSESANFQAFFRNFAQHQFSMLSELMNSRPCAAAIS